MFFSFCIHHSFINMYEGRKCIQLIKTAAAVDSLIISLWASTFNTFYHRKILQSAQKNHVFGYFD